MTEREFQRVGGTVTYRWPGNIREPQNAIERALGNKTAAADALGITRMRLYTS